MKAQQYGSVHTVGENAKKADGVYGNMEHQPLLMVKSPERSFFAINKPLIPLKICIVFWFAAGAILDTYLILYFKDLGLSVSDLSIIYILNPIFQLSGALLSGIIADRIGSSKPVLLIHFVLATLFANLALFVPHVNNKRVQLFSENAHCIPSAEKRSWFDCNVLCPGENPTNSRQISCIIPEENVVHMNVKYQEDFKRFLQKYNASILYNNDRVHNDLPSPWSDSSYASNCKLTCDLDDWSPVDESFDNFTFVFISSLVIIIGFNTSYATIYRIFDSTVMRMIDKHNSSFGVVRTYAMVSVAIFTPLAGLAIDLTTPAGSTRNYDFAFYIFDGLVIFSILAMFKMDVCMSSTGDKMLKMTWKVLRNTEVLIFFAVLITLGTANGFTKVFTPLFLEELQATTMLYSLLTAIGGAIGLPFLATTRWWIKVFGSTNLFLMAFATHVVVCMGFSYIMNPWWSLLMECGVIFTYHLLWVSVVPYIYQISPDGLRTTVTAAAGAIHFSVGRGTGSLIGGLIMGAYGARWAYQIIAVITSIIGLLYAVYLQVKKIREMKRSDRISPVENKGSYSKNEISANNAS